MQWRQRRQPGDIQRGLGRGQLQIIQLAACLELFALREQGFIERDLAQSV